MMMRQGQILRYALLPGLLPRLHYFITHGFAYTAFLTALIYQALGLLPAHHPYLRTANYGRYGVRHVIAEAANHLTFSWRHLDQIVIFVVLLIAIAIFIGMVGMFILSLFIYHPALAQEHGGPWSIFSVNYEHNPGPTQDIAFMILDRVFGVRGIFESCVSDPGNPCRDLSGNILPDAFAEFPAPMHLAMHTLMQFFSNGIFIVSIIIILYYVITLTAETAVTGTPFGQRFNKLWGPLRLILFLGMLVPLNVGGVNGGLNGAQLTVLWTAKFGSNLATNAWGRFNDVLTTSYLGQVDTLIARPNIPELGDVVKFMFVAKTCRIAEEVAYGYPDGGIQPYIVRESFLKDVLDGGTDPRTSLPLMETSYAEAAQFANYGTIVVRFGHYDEKENGLYRGAVRPICGQIRLPVTATDMKGDSTSAVKKIHEYYYDLLRMMWTDAAMTRRAECIVKNKMQDVYDPSCKDLPDLKFGEEQMNQSHEFIEAHVVAALNEQADNGKWAVPADLMVRGWGGAGLWYNRIAQINGAVSGAIMNLPQPDLYPDVMEQIADYRRSSFTHVSSDKIFEPPDNVDEKIDYDRPRDGDIAIPLYQAYSFWQADSSANPRTSRTGNMFLDAINAVFGTSGIFSMRDNANIHPLAQLTALGRGMMDATLRNFALGATGSGLNLMFKSSESRMIKTFTSFLWAMANMTLVISIILYYILPFIPFIYFFLSIGEWIKAVFEALIAMPLWALAHITRMDGDGLPGPAAANGYFLLFEILIRPILIVIALLTSMSIFGATVKILNGVFDLALSNLTGSGVEEAASMTEGIVSLVRGPVDELFYTALYAVICYMLALSSFKLIDQIPNQILRWMGTGVSPLHEGVDSQVSGMTKRTVQGITLATQKLQGGALASVLGLR
ncbi:MAG: DotA/TraY family protein [Alphaproteobacteria bacterium]|nr:DotA/TraY family protein [Alphaproteobacteria bacterium]